MAKLIEGPTIIQAAGHLLARFRMIAGRLNVGHDQQAVVLSPA